MRLGRWHRSTKRPSAGPCCRPRHRTPRGGPTPAPRRRTIGRSRRRPPARRRPPRSRLPPTHQRCGLGWPDTLCPSPMATSRRVVRVLVGLNATGARKVPDDAPVDFVPSRWRGYLERAEAAGDVTAYRHYWELCVLLALRDGLRCGDVFVPGSRRYADPASFLLTPGQWEPKRAEFSALVERSPDPTRDPGHRLPEASCQPCRARPPGHRGDPAARRPRRPLAPGLPAAVLVGRRGPAGAPQSRRPRSSSGGTPSTFPRLGFVGSPSAGTAAPTTTCGRPCLWCWEQSAVPAGSHGSACPAWGGSSHRHQPTCWQEAGCPTSLSCPQPVNPAAEPGNAALSVSDQPYRPHSYRSL